MKTPEIVANGERYTFGQFDHMRAAAWVRVAADGSYKRVPGRRLPALLDAINVELEQRDRVHEARLRELSLQLEHLRELRTKKSWRCFHCGDVFTREQDAAEHFGGQLNALAGCQVKGHELTLLGYVRELEVAVNRWIDDRHPLQLAMAQLQAEHAAALRKAEEDGYNRGVQDMKREGLGVIA